VKEFFHAKDDKRATFQRSPSLGGVKSLRLISHGESHPAIDATLIGQSEPMRLLKLSIQTVAKSSETVLITGESGTGKELIARLVHELSARCNGPYLAVNCGALSESLLESELFGHVKGAFTGAIGTKKGFFESAGNGTIFLDEFAEMLPAMQAKLLRVLEERKVRPVGMTDAKEISFNARVIVATNRDLRKDVREGKFRQDLYYRVNVLQINAPALRFRCDDIELLAKHFIHRYNERNDCQVSDHFSSTVLRQLKSYPWPGNVRELENAISRLANMLQDSSALRSAGLSPQLDWSNCKPKLRNRSPKSQLPLFTPIKRHASERLATVRHEAKRQKDLERYERVLEISNGNVSEAARLLRIPRSTLQSRLLVLKSKSQSIRTSPLTH